MPYQQGSQRGSLWRRSPQTGSDFQSLNTVVFQNAFCKGFLWIKYETCIELLDNRELIVHYNSNLSMVLPSAKEVLKNNLSNEMTLSGQKRKGCASYLLTLQFFIKGTHCRASAKFLWEILTMRYKYCTHGNLSDPHKICMSWSIFCSSKSQRLSNS